MRKDRKITDLRWGLFNYRGKYFLSNIKDIPIYFKRKKFLKKHGYTEPAEWETWLWFITVMKEILTWYRYKRVGTPWIIESYPDKRDSDNVITETNEKVWDAELDKMISLLDKMNFDDVCVSTDAIEAKDEFFRMFSKYFYDFWD